MSFDHENGYDAIKFTANGVSGQRALDGYLLRFSVGYELPPWREEWGPTPSVFRNFRAWAEVGPNRLRAGHPKAENALVLFSHDHPQSAAILFDLLLPTSAIEKLEEMRGGGDLEIVLRLNAERKCQNHATVHADIRYQIGQSQWVRVLKQMEFGAYLLCEIPIELGDNSELREVWTAMTHARELLYGGHYSHVVVECRKALDAATSHLQMDEDIQLAAQKSRGNRDSREAMSKRERVINLVAAAKHVTQLGAHPDPHNQIVDYSRREALLILSVVAAAIAEMAERPINQKDMSSK